MNILKQISKKESQIQLLQSELDNLKNQLNDGSDLEEWLINNGFKNVAPDEYLREINDRFWLYAVIDEGEYKLLCIDNDNCDVHDCVYFNKPEAFKKALLEYEPIYEQAVISIDIYATESEAANSIRETINNMSDKSLLSCTQLK